MGKIRKNETDPRQIAYYVAGGITVVSGIVTLLILKGMFNNKTIDGNDFIRILTYILIAGLITGILSIFKFAHKSAALTVIGGGTTLSFAYFYSIFIKSGDLKKTFGSFFDKNADTTLILVLTCIMAAGVLTITICGFFQKGRRGFEQGYRYRIWPYNLAFIINIFTLFFLSLIAARSAVYIFELKDRVFENMYSAIAGLAAFVIFVGTMFLLNTNKREPPFKLIFILLLFSFVFTLICIFTGKTIIWNRIIIPDFMEKDNIFITCFILSFVLSILNLIPIYKILDEDETERRIKEREMERKQKEEERKRIEEEKRIKKEKEEEERKRIEEERKRIEEEEKKERKRIEEEIKENIKTERNKIRVQLIENNEYYREILEPAADERYKKIFYPLLETGNILGKAILFSLYIGTRENYEQMEVTWLGENPRAVHQILEDIGITNAASDITQLIKALKTEKIHGYLSEQYGEENCELLIDTVNKIRKLRNTLVHTDPHLGAELWENEQALIEQIETVLRILETHKCIQNYISRRNYIMEHINIELDKTPEKGNNGGYYYNICIGKIKEIKNNENEFKKEKLLFDLRTLLTDILFEALRDKMLKNVNGKQLSSQEIIEAIKSIGEDKTVFSELVKIIMTESNNESKAYLQNICTTLLEENRKITESDIMDPTALIDLIETERINIESCGILRINYESSMRTVKGYLNFLDHITEGYVIDNDYYTCNPCEFMDKVEHLHHCFDTFFNYRRKWGRTWIYSDEEYVKRFEELSEILEF